MYRKFAADAQLECFVLYNGEQIVYEHVGRLE